ncbi:MAG: HlyD family efflux transporter periplasmic adaptor subunit, partial [Chloroflexi bacterium]|nr:HlyD family efflux transporter periplasmic adaptor subunit [Chloroflexota bacterium]
AYRLEAAYAADGRQVAQAAYDAVLNQRWAVGQQVAAQQTGVDGATLAADFLRRSGVDPMLRLAVEQAEKDLAATELVAPFDGVVLDVLVRPGAAIFAGDALLVMSDPKAGEVRTTVIEEDLSMVRIGQLAELFFDARPDVAVVGTVARIVPQRVEGEARPLYHVYLALADELPNSVLPGMTVDASIVIDEATEVLRLPRALVRARSDGTAVLDMWQNGRSTPQEITVGLRGDVFIEIVDGVDVGDEVVAE